MAGVFAVDVCPQIAAAVVLAVIGLFAVELILLLIEMVLHGREGGEDEGEE